MLWVHVPNLECEGHPLVALQLWALLVTLQLLVLPHQLLHTDILYSSQESQVVRRAERSQQDMLFFMNALLRIRGPWHFNADPDPDPHLWLMDPDLTPGPTPFFSEFKDPYLSLNNKHAPKAQTLIKYLKNQRFINISTSLWTTSYTIYKPHTHRGAC